MNFNPPTFRHRYLDLRPLKLQLKLGETDGQMLGLGVHDPKWWRNYLHMHSFYEVCFAFQGTGTFRINGTVYPIKKGDLFLARPNEVHEIVADEKYPLGIYYWSFTLPKTTASSTPTSSLNSLISNFKDSRIIVTPGAKIEPVLQLVTAELNVLAPGFKTGVQGLGNKLIIDTLRWFAEPVPATSASGLADETLEQRQLLDPQSAFINDMIQFLYDNYQRPIKVRDVAAQMHLSERHANRQFKRTTGRPIMTYLTQIRLEKAKELLLNPNLMIGDIALAVGIEDVRYFSTLFRKHMALSPTAYRQQNGTTFVSAE